MIQHYGESFYPGLLFTEESARKVKRRDPNRIRPKENCFMFRFFDREEGEMGGKKVSSEAFNYSPKYFVAGKVFSLADVKDGKLGGDVKILITNMEVNHHSHVIKTQIGNIQEIEKKDFVVLRGKVVPASKLMK